jgi:hypothetical protein
VYGHIGGLCSFSTRQIIDTGIGHTASGNDLPPVNSTSLN